jgi:hypothetical protein
MKKGTQGTKRGRWGFRGFCPFDKAREMGINGESIFR